MPIMRGRLRGRKWIVGSSNHGCWLGTYEFEQRVAFEATVTESSVVFDVGAHVGFYTLLASVLVGPAGKVFAFEPLPRNLRYLTRHLQLNGIDNVTVVEAAVSNISGAACFEEGPTTAMGRISPKGVLNVRTIALDELVQSGELPSPDYIKMDIEGAEFAALWGAKSILEQSHPTLFLATHGRDIHQRCCQFLRALEYQLKALDGAAIEESSELLAWCSHLS